MEEKTITIDALQKELNLVNKRLSKNETKQGSKILPFFIVLIIVVEVGIGYVAYKNYEKSSQKGVSVEYVDALVAKNAIKIDELEKQNSDLKAFIQQQNREHINEFIINRKAINAQQKMIKENTKNIDTGKKYQVIKNPF